jgi:uncharacterized FlaG/YvyC family protein
LTVQAVNTVGIRGQTSDSVMTAVSNVPLRHMQAQQKAESEIKNSQSLLVDVQHVMQMMSDVSLHFSVDKSTGRTVVKVVDKESEKLIREIPAEELLKLAAKIEEMMGILFDKNF